MKMILFSFSLLALLLLFQPAVFATHYRPMQPSQPTDLSVGGNHTASPHGFSRGKAPHGFSSGKGKAEPWRSDTLPPLATLHASIDTFHAHAAHSSLLELQESRRGNWLKYLPALGLAYTPTGAPRPGLSYSTAVIYQAKKDKQTRAAKRLAILEQAQVAARRDKEALLPYLERHLSLRRELAAALQLLELDRELLSYWQQELAAKNIGPVEFLGKRKDFLEKEAGIERLRDRLRELEAEVLAKAHFFEE